MVVSLAQFRLMRIVGRGAFGKVRIVEHYETRQLYALKYINKEECIKMDAVRNILRERAILEQLDHPFLCRLRFAFQDSDYMYMVTDLMLGGDLHYHISKQQFDEDVLRFWFAELATAVKYLHCNHVVHRDIKPQNILLDDMGHVHITDFNIATYLHHKRVLTSNSGTGYYMAPEIYKGGGYNEAVDWWSLGITLYECVYGKRPFENFSSEELKTAIRRGCIPYPDAKSVSGECLSVMQGFLELDPNRRLGQGDAGWVALVRHPFFRTIDWRRLEAKEIKPPFQPSTDTNNFDLTYDLEELILGNSSNVQARRASKASRALEENAKKQRDLQLIQEKFIQFDHTVYEKYEGFKDPVRMTVGDPPDWVKPAFEGAEQGDLLPVKRITTMSMADWQQDDGSLGSSIPPSPVIPAAHHAATKEATSRNRNLENVGSWRGPNRSASTSNLAAKAEQDAQITPWKRLSLGTVRAKRASGEPQLAKENSPGSLSEEYAMSLHGLRKKQSTRNFLERRERDRKSIHHDLNNAHEPHFVDK